MKIVVGYVMTPEGNAALDAAIAEAKLRDAELLVLHSRDPRRTETDMTAIDQELGNLEALLTNSGVTSRVIDVPSGNVATDIFRTVQEEGAELIVIGVRRRSAAGKLLMGSNSQEILLGADCPVLAVKAK